MAATKPYILGIDTGGTFTDVCVLKEDGEIVINKAPTTPGRFAEGVLNAVREVASAMNLRPEELLAGCSLFKHGTTVATNALITRTGSRVGFLTTAGFEDTTLIMRAIGRVDGLSDEELRHGTFVTKPVPLVPKALVRGVHERVDYLGRVVAPLSDEEARAAIRTLVEDEGAECLAISLLFGWMNPVHERRLAELVRELYGPERVELSLAHELAPILGEYARANTVIIDAFLSRTVRRYMESLGVRLQEGRFDGELMVLQANGGIVSPGEMTAVGSLQSGPAGGMIASSFMANLLGHPNVITADMGGTSFDVGVISDGHWHTSREPIVERSRIFQPVIDIESIGAGGGTICRVDAATGRLVVGPQSAGADPGPVCYGMGGEQPTITDADVVLGIIDPDYFLGGRRRLDRERATAAIEERIARPLGIPVVDAAAGIFEVINNKMSDLIRKQVFRTGYTPEEFVLYCFGGAGPVHAAGFGAELGIRQVYIVPTSLVFSAFGAATSDILHTRILSRRYDMPCDPAELGAQLAGLEAGLGEIMGREGFRSEDIRYVWTFYMRYRRQVTEVEVVEAHHRLDAAAVRSIVEHFERRYEELYGVGAGFREAGVELVSVRVDAVGRTVKPTPRHFGGGGDAAASERAPRQVYFGRERGGWQETRIYDYERLGPGCRVAGPAIIETPFTTVLIPPGKRASVDEWRNVVLELA